MTFLDRVKFLCACQLLLTTVFLNQALAEASPRQDRDREVMAILDEYMDAFNRRDMVAHTATLHYPHFRYTSGDITIWNTPRDFFPYIDSPKAEREKKLRELYVGLDWDHSEWTRRDIVQGDSKKVHVATTFVRFREDGSEIGAFESLYIVTFEQGRWAIKGRSSFAPK